MHVAIIAEYNPFHNGHAYQIEQIRAQFGADTHISVILGGIFSQRGEPYIAPPYVRAEAAILCGADLCVELPFPFSCAPASIFARAGVEIAVGLGASVLAFGSENGNIDSLIQMRERLDGPEMQAALASASDEAAGKTRTYTRVYKELYGAEAPTLPNDILAIEYLRAIDRLHAPITPFTILRKGDYKSGEGGFASASSLRRAFSTGGLKAMQSGMPQAAYAVFAKASEEGLFAPDYEKLAAAVLLRLAEPSEGIAFTGGGLAERLRHAAKEAKSIDELCRQTATKRYTDAEIARAILYTFLEVTRADLDAPVAYTRLLAIGKSGRALLANPQIEILTKPSAPEKLSDAARAQFTKTLAAERAYALCLRGKYDHLRQSPKVEKVCKP